MRRDIGRPFPCPRVCDIKWRNLLDIFAILPRCPPLPCCIPPRISSFRTCHSWGVTTTCPRAPTVSTATIAKTARLRTTIQGVVSGLHRGFGFGLGAVIGGILYAGLGARLCFGVSAVLPSLSLVLLALPTARSYFSRCGSIRAIGVGEGDRNVSRGSYELVDKVRDQILRGPACDT